MKEGIFLFIHVLANGRICQYFFSVVAHLIRGKYFSLLFLIEFLIKVDIFSIFTLEIWKKYFFHMFHVCLQDTCLGERYEQELRFEN